MARSAGKHASNSKRNKDDKYSSIRREINNGTKYLNYDGDFNLKSNKNNYDDENNDIENVEVNEEKKDNKSFYEKLKDNDYYDEVNGTEDYDNNDENDENYDNDEEDEEDEEDEDGYDGFWDDEREINYKKIAIVIIIALVLIIGCILLFNKKDKKEVDTGDEQTSLTDQETFPSKVGQYNVIGKIIIDKIKVEQYILDSSENDALDKGVSKIYGPSLNSYGNLTIAGHNYDDKFKKLSELEKGDTFKIVDRKKSETTYKITEIYTVEPDDLKPLMQNDEKVEITLVTCENGSTKRLIVKAEEQLSSSYTDNSKDNG